MIFSFSRCRMDFLCLKLSKGTCFKSAASPTENCKKGENDFVCGIVVTIDCVADGVLINQTLVSHPAVVNVLEEGNQMFFAATITIFSNRFFFPLIDITANVKRAVNNVRLFRLPRLASAAIIEIIQFINIAFRIHH
jgi:hypothetical protein